MGILSSFFDVVAGVSILAGRSSLLDTNLTTIAGRNFTVRGALGLSFLSVGFINLWATSRKQRKIERLTKDAETLGAELWKPSDAEFWEYDFINQQIETGDRDDEKNHRVVGKNINTKDGELIVELHNDFQREGLMSWGDDEHPLLNKLVHREYDAESFNAPAAVMRTYKGRKSPALSARSVKVGTRKRGNDGKMWQVRSVKSRGKRTQRWFKD